MRESAIPQMKQRYLAYIWQETEKAERRAQGKPVKQILLLHSNLLNSYCLDDILRMYKEHGYQFISLQDALANPAEPILLPVKKDVSRKHTSHADLVTN
jgi:hypothetical protein